MAMNPNANMAGMNPMGGPVGGAPMPMMNNGVALNPQQAAAAAAARHQQANNDNRSALNTYIYEYFLRYGMFDCARSLLSGDHQVNTTNRRRDDNGNVINGVGDDPMDTDSKDDLDSKLPEDLPPPKLPMPASDASFLYEWFCLFWDIYNAQRAKGGNGTVNQYVSHTQQQSRLKQNHQQELLRQMRPDMAAQQQQYQAQMVRNMQNGAMGMNMKQNNLARAAMANNQNNPQMQMLQQQAKQNQMQRDPSGMDANRERPSSPASGENAPSPSKRQRIEPPFNPNQPGAMMANGRPAQGMPQQMAGNPSAQAAQQMLAANGINPNSLNPQQFQNFVNAPPAAQQKSIATYSQNLQQHHGTQMGGKQMPNAGGPQNQGSPMMPQGPDGTALNAYYNPGDMSGPGGIRPGPGGAQQAGSNHALQDYQMQLMLLEQQNKKRLMMARQEQDNMGGMPRDAAGPGGPPGPNGQFPDTSPQAGMRTGTSPNPGDMKRTPQMNSSGIPSPVPEGGQSRGSPNSNMNFMGNHVDPNSMGPHFFKAMDGNMAAQAQAQMNGMRPPGSHPGQPFNGQINPQMMAARQQQAGQGNPQWQPGPNGQMVPQGMQPNQPVQGTQQQRSMPPPSAPAAAGGNANSRTTASPQQAAAAPPTPNQTAKSNPKKKNEKAKDKRSAAQKKNQNANAAAAAASENSGEPEAAAPATPMTPVNAPNFNKNGQSGAGAQNGQANAAVAASAPPPAPVPAQQTHTDPNAMGMDNFGGMPEFSSMDLVNPLQSADVLNDFDFDSFLHEDGDNPPFEFGSFPGMEGGEIGAD